MTFGPPRDAAPHGAATQTPDVRRPDPGLARGVWEAPRWSFFVAMGLILALAALYALRRAGLLRRRTRRAA